MGGAREQHVDALLDRHAGPALADELLGAIEEGGGLVAALGELAGEQEARDGGRLVGGLAGVGARRVLGRVVGGGEREVARVGLEQRGVFALREALEGGDGALEGAARDPRGVLLEALRRRLARQGGVSRGAHEGLDAAVRRADAQGEERAVLVAAGLHHEAIRALAEHHAGREALGVERAVFRVLEDGLAVPEHLRGARAPEPQRHGARALAFACILHERGRVHAGLLGGAHEGAGVEPPELGHVGDGAPAHRALLAVVGAPEGERLAEVFLGAEHAGEAGLALVVERARHEPLADVAEPRDLCARPVEIAATAASVGLEQPGVDSGRRRERAVGRELAEGLFELGGIALVVLEPQRAQRRVDAGALRPVRLVAEAPQLLEAVAEARAGRGGGDARRGRDQGGGAGGEGGEDKREPSASRAVDGSGLHPQGFRPRTAVTSRSA
ncbi:MAG TPA: hypothetical protein PLR99_09725 [Polyangiaceae bacterium]|nr:hypothetical protein [Polyangiaceae bacterium]